MPQKDKNITPSVTQKLQSLGYNVADWDDSRTETKLTNEISQVLSHASKKENGKQGYPDRIYVNARKKFLVLVEEKSSIKDHDHPSKEKGAMNGIKWYLSRFFNANLPPQVKNFFDHWKILGIAVSGDLSLAYQHKFNCFTIDAKQEKIVPLAQVTNFMTEEQFLALFNSLDEENAIAIVSSSSKKINNLLRSVDSQKRPVLLSALMICLHKPKTENCVNDFPDHFKTYQPATIITNVLDTVKKVLKTEGISDEKLQALSAELAFLAIDQTLNNTSILKDILVELETAVIPLFNNQFATNSNYDIIGKFYEEFLKYAGISNVKRGIILTPRHITSLFTKLIDLKDNDKIVDICCGTGAFLIAGMNALVDKINKSSRADKNEAIKKIKEEQLLGFELNPTMYICAISNMLFRGDGKSSIFNYDSINNPEAQKELDRFKATVGFINPPYSGQENKTDPTPKEITFLVKLLDNCSRYGVIIAPLSAYFKDDHIREAILKKHTLKYVINMPRDLFQPNASTHTAIAVFETNRSFNDQTDEITFFDLQDDGFVLAKNQGRTDIFNRWAEKENELLKSLQPTSLPDNIILVRTKIKPKDEWTIFAHSKTDYSTLCEEDFIKSISDYMLFRAKKDLDILFSDITEMETFEAIGNYFSNNRGINIESKNKRQHLPIDMTGWKEYKLNTLFDIYGVGAVNVETLLTQYGSGCFPYITRTEKNNGVSGFYNYKMAPANVLTIETSLSGLCFYHEYEFSTGDHIAILKPKNFELNKYIALFIISVWRKNAYKYDYGRPAIIKNQKNTMIPLPALSNGLPDWRHMEEYVKNLLYGDLI